MVLVVDTPRFVAPKLPVTPLNVTVIGRFIGKFEPVIKSGIGFFQETTPETGVIAIEDTVDVKVAVAVLEAESVTEITCAVGRNAGTMNVTSKAPNGEIAEKVTGTVRLSIERPVKVADFAKPEPMIVTVVPTAAFDGLTTVMAGAPVPVNDTEPVIPVTVIA